MLIFFKKSLKRSQGLLYNLLIQKIDNFNYKTYSLKKYLSRNENLWNEGLMFDFLQKKTTDKWIRKFILHSASLFSDRFLFEYITKFFYRFLIKPLNNISIFSNITPLNMISNIIFVISFLFLLIFFWYIMF